MFEFIETTVFKKQVSRYLTDDEFSALQWWIGLHPESGDLIPKSGGLRKLRWEGKGRGKSGGYRVIYYLQDHLGRVWLLTIYAKNEETNIPAHKLREMRRKLIDE